MDYSDYLSKNIRYLRKLVGLSQEDFAAYLGYRSFTTAQKWESGQSDPPIGTLLNICDLFQVTSDDLTSTDLEAEDDARGGRNLTATRWMLKQRKSVNDTIPPGSGIADLQDAITTEVPGAVVEKRTQAAAKAARHQQLDAEIQQSATAPEARVGVLIAQAAKDPEVVKALKMLLNMSPEDRELAIDMLIGLSGDDGQ